MITIEIIENDAKNFINSYVLSSYIISYTEYINYFESIKEFNRHNVILGSYLVYGWMPKILKFNPDEFNKNINDIVKLINTVRNKELLNKDDLGILKTISNNSLVGISKLLHFINPKKYAIWDSNVLSYLKSKDGNCKYKIDNCSDYLDYINKCNEIVNNPKYDKIHNSIVKKVGYEMSKLRTIELIMFSSSVKK